MMVEEGLKISRHRTAMRRSSISRPMSAAVRDGIIRENTTVFDYGCGFGTDIEILKASGYNVAGWDPFYFPENTKLESDVVNLGFVLNVIEDQNERLQALQKAFELAKECLVVSVRTDAAFFENRFGDGAITKDGSFQKIYSQSEFRSYVEESLGRKLHIVEPGVGYVFKSEHREHEFSGSRYLSRLASYDKTIVKKIHEAVDANRVAKLIEDLGRVPSISEVAELSFLSKGKFKGFLESSVMPLVNMEIFEQSRSRIREDILQALAMTRIENQKFLQAKDLPLDFQIRIREAFGDYKDACKSAESMLFSLGKEGAVAHAGRNAKIGKLLPEDLYVHSSALEHIPVLMKLMLSLAESIVGKVAADVVKFSLHGKSMSFLFYQEFETDPHPALQGSLRVDFKSGKYQFRDYSKSENPPILHRKETFVHSSYPLFSQFQNLTLSEEDAGLLGHANIGNRRQWMDMLDEKGFLLQGHKLIRKS